MLKKYSSTSFFKLIFTAIAVVSFYCASAQYNTATINNAIGTDEYGIGNVNNYNVGGAGGQTWYMNWDANYLYISILNANTAEFGIVYLDINPIVPVNGGTNANGSTDGLTNFDNLTPKLPFRADAAIVFKDVLRGVYKSNGTGGWSIQSFGPTGFGATAPNDVVAGWYSTGANNRELKISWNQLTGGAGIPASFNWLGYMSYNCSNTCGGMYGQVPSGNPSGSFAVGSTPNMVRYFTVSTTANGSATNPTSRDSYTHIGGSVASFGNITCYDFTMNTSGQTITRLTGPGFKDWTINGTMVINNGAIYFGAYNAAFGVTDYGTTTINNLIISGGELNFDYDTYVTTVTGNVTQTGGLFYLGDRTNSFQGDLELRGNWNRTAGVFGVNHKAVFFSGTSLQTISGIGTLFPYVNLNNPAGVLLLSGNDTIQDTLWLANGNLTLGNNRLTVLGLNGQTATSTGAIVFNNTNSFIITDGLGVLEQKQIGPTGRSAPVLFPIGNSATDYHPLTITNSGTTDDLNVRVFNNVYTGGSQGAGALISTSYVNRTWAIGETTTGGSNLNLNFQYNQPDELAPFDRTNCAVVYHNGTSWLSTQPLGPVAGSNPYTLATTGISLLGNFSISNNLLSPLPVNLIAFKADLIGNDGYVHWTTTNEINADYYSLERSTDGIHFNEIMQTPAQNSSSVYKNYLHIDKEISSLGVDVVYYRLNQFDKNGNHQYSNIVSLKLTTKANSYIAAIYPNPCTSFLTVNYFSNQNEKIGLEIFNSHGAIIRSTAFEVSEGINNLPQNELQDLASGLYFIRITNQQQQINFKFTKR